jgi:hypothetical protein
VVRFKFPRALQKAGSSGSEDVFLKYATAVSQPGNHDIESSHPVPPGVGWIAVRREKGRKCRAFERSALVAKAVSCGERGVRRVGEQT